MRKVLLVLVTIVLLYGAFTVFMTWWDEGFVL
jgi:hypothetical protein